MIVMKNEIENRGYCVYVHTNKINGKKYVGQTSMGIEKRWGKNGVGYLGKINGKYRQTLFARAILKYGWDNFQHEVIENNLTKEDADSLEKSLIKKLNTTNSKYGYNCKEGGSNGKHSEESKRKMSETHKKIKVSEETRMKISESNKGRIVTEETRKKISKALSGENNPMYGRQLSEEHRKKISYANKGRVPSDEERRKMSEAAKGENNHFYGRHHSEETKRKMSESRMGKLIGAKHSSSIRVVQYDLQGCLLKIWDCIRDAERELMISKGNISKCCRGKTKTAGGFIWKYYDETNEVA